MATDSTNSAPPPGPAPWTPPKRSGAGLIAIVLIVLATAAVALAWFTPKDSKVAAQRGLVEVSLNWFTALGFLLLPVFAIWITVAAIRGFSKGGFASFGVSRGESPAAFWMTFYFYLILAILSLLGVLKVVYHFIGEMSKV